MTAWIALGPPQHGVVILAERICSDLQHVVRAVNIGELLQSAELRQALSAGTSAHVHFTDRLFGADCNSAATAFVELAALVSEYRGELSVTLHDLPTKSDETGRFQRRASAYNQVIAAATGRVIVSSAHEANLLVAIAAGARPIVIPLPVEAGQRGQRPAESRSRDVTILGFLYPGNGHADVLEALAALPAEVGLTALGRVADGHQGVADELARRAHELGRGFSVTGWIPAGELPSALGQAAIPMLGPRQISASSSIGSWLSAGRRPIVADAPYTRELLARMPGALTLYAPEGLVDVLRRARADPDSTWLPPEVSLGPSARAVASAYCRAVTS